VTVAGAGYVGAMTTLVDYAATHFPAHEMDAPLGDVQLVDHTTVAHVVGAKQAGELAARMSRLVPDVPVGLVIVHQNPPHVRANQPEDKEGVFDLPQRRLITAALATALVAGVVVGVIFGLVAESVWTGIISGAFAALLGGICGWVASGGGRFAGERGWQQPNRPGEDVALVAVLTPDEATATKVAREMERDQPHDVRIVGRDGAWHSPHS
jgi:hypothetical protein